jgi:hypothetical protein
MSPDTGADYGHISATADSSLRFESLPEFVQRPTSSSYVRGVIPAKALIVVFGPPKGGKTFSVCDLTMHAAHGLDWHGCAIPRRMRVVYLCGEGVNGLRVRLKAWLEHHDSIGVKGDFHVLPRALSLPDQASNLVDTLQTLKPDILVTDTLNAYFGAGDENATVDMTTFCNAVRQLRDQLGCSIVIIHHTGHEGIRERGSIVLRASADVIVQVAKDETAGELVGFQVITARDLEPMEVPIGLRLVKHQTEWLDEDGEPLGSCIVQAADQPVTLPGRGGRPLGEAQATILRLTKEHAQGKSADANGEIIIARHEVNALAKTAGLSRQSISSAWQPLAHRGFLRLIEPGSVALRVRT